MATSNYVEGMRFLKRDQNTALDKNNCLYLEHGSLAIPPFQSLIAMCKDSLVHQSAVPWFFYNPLPSKFC